MRQAIPLILVLLSVWGLSSPASACEKHLNGHQNSSDTASEASQK